LACNAPSAFKHAPLCFLEHCFEMPPPHADSVLQEAWLRERTRVEPRQASNRETLREQPEFDIRRAAGAGLVYE